MDSDFEIDEDSDVELEELNQLNAVLHADEPSTSTAPYQYENNYVFLTASVDQQLAKIDSAIELNKEMNEKLRRLEQILTNRLAECRKKLKTLMDLGAANERQESFRYFYCGKPYFKDKNNFPAPDNEDTILMNNTQMYDFSQVSSVPGWTVRDKGKFVVEILKMSLKLRKDELHSKISKLRRENQKRKNKKIENLIAGFSREICKLKQKQLNELALPLDKEYDWEALANKLNRRHTPQEYRALWKLFFHPSINKNGWSKTEHNALQKIATDNNLRDWNTIAKKLGSGRTGYQCFVYFRTNMTNQFSGKKWSTEEVEYLRRLVDYYKEDNYIPWGKVAASMENRTKIQIYNKYLRLLGNRKGRFLPEEDAVILNCTYKFGANFKKMLAYLPGRSIIQIRNRYNVLSKMRVSMVWTESEDRKLVQLMANSDSNVTYSSISHFFPGKDRVHIRSRYTTLVKWMRKNPNLDIAYAPRRAARRLTHGQPTENLNKSLENLGTRMQTAVNLKKYSKISKDSPETCIDEAIIAALYSEYMKELDTKQVEVPKDLVEPVNSVSSVNINVTNLRNVLLLLHANLDKVKYTKSHFSDLYPGLDNSTGSTSTKLKSYSKKNTFTSINRAMNLNPDVWGNNTLGTVKYVLPPHYATITGCRSLMAFTTSKNKLADEGLNFHMLMKKNQVLRKQFNLLMERFQVLFIWPMLLSNEGPDHNTILENTMREIDLRKSSEPSTSTSSSTSKIVPSIPSVHVPAKYRRANEKAVCMEHIDLNDENTTENISIKEDLTEHNLIDFNY